MSLSPSALTHPRRATSADASAAPSATDIEPDVRAFVEQNFYVADPGALGAETSLLDSGVIDSTGVLEVIAFLEERFGVEVADEEMLPENFDSIGRIARYVARKQG